MFKRNRDDSKFKQNGPAGSSKGTSSSSSSSNSDANADQESNGQVNNSKFVEVSIPMEQPEHVVHIIDEIRKKMEDMESRLKNQQVNFADQLKKVESKLGECEQDMKAWKSRIVQVEEDINLFSTNTVVDEARMDKTREELEKIKSERAELQKIPETLKKIQVEMKTLCELNNKNIAKLLELTNNGPTESTECKNIDKLKEDIVNIQVRERERNVIIHNFRNFENETPSNLRKKIRDWLSEEYQINRDSIITAFRFGNPNKAMRPIRVEFKDVPTKRAVLRSNIQKCNTGIVTTITPDLPREKVLENQLRKATQRIATERGAQLEWHKGDLYIDGENWKASNYLQEAKQIAA